MRLRAPLRRSAPFAPALGAACTLAVAFLQAQAQAQEVVPATSVPVSPTSQCVEGPGAPPADPTKVTRVLPGQATAPAGAGASPPAPAEEPSLDDPPAPGAPPRVLLEAGVHAGVSVRFDDARFFETTRRAGLVLGGSVLVSPSRLLGLGLTYAHADLDRIESPGSSADVIALEYEAHTLLAEARVTPIRFSSVALFASIGGGLAWQEASLRATFVPVTGSPGGSIACRTGSDAEFAFRAGLGMKARLGRAVSFLLDASFLGYRLSTEVLGGCAPGAGTAQTVMVRAGLTYDVDITRLVR